MLSGRVTVDGETVLEAEDVMCALIDADDLADARGHRAAPGDAHDGPEG